MPHWNSWGRDEGDEGREAFQHAVPCNHPVRKVLWTRWRKCKLLSFHRMPLSSPAFHPPPTRQNTICLTAVVEASPAAPSSAPIPAATSQRRTPVGWPGQAVVRAARSFTAQPGSPAQPDRNTSPGSFKKCASCCSEPHTLRRQSLPLQGAAPLALIQLLTNKSTHHFLAGW